jgi:hypothetical protein
MTNLRRPGEKFLGRVGGDDTRSAAALTDCATLGRHAQRMAEVEDCTAENLAGFLKIAVMRRPEALIAP